MTVKLEKEVEAALRRMIEKHGGKCLKWVCPGWAGVPDRICLLPGGLIYFVETKRPEGGTRAALQKKWAEWLTSLGFTHLWVLNRDDVDDLEGLIRYEEEARDWSHAEAHEVHYEREVK